MSATVFDFAARIRAKLAGGRVDDWKLLKLVYYVQAWSLAHRGQPAFAERIEAWRDGPVARVLWTDITYNRGRITDAGRPLSGDDDALVDLVLTHYGAMTPDQLVAQTHREAPWIDARGDLDPRAHGDAEITTDAMRAYYARMLDEAREDADRSTRARATSPLHSVDELERHLGI